MAISWSALAFWRRWKKQPRPAPGVASPQVRLDTVFTPSRPANQAYVKREGPEQDLRTALKTPGTQIVIYGESGAGKSSLAHRVMADLGRTRIVTSCDAATSYEDVLTSGFHQIGANATTGVRQTDEATVGAKGTVGVPGVAGAESHTSWTVNNEKLYSPVVEAPRTAEHLARRLGAAGVSWIIDDFHKVSDETKESLAHALKVFSDMSQEFPRTTIVVLGAANTPAEVWGSPANLPGRLASIEVPPLTPEELGAILDTGSELLNVDFSKVRTEIIRHSVGLASVTHALAFMSCQELGVEDPAAECVLVTPAALEAAKRSYGRTRAPQVREAFEKALAVVQRKRKFDNYALILSALASFGESGATHSELYLKIRQTEPDYPSGNLTTYIVRLQKDDRGAVIRKTLGGQYRFSTPLMHTHARMLFDINAVDTFWTEVEPTASEKLKAANALAGLGEDLNPDPRKHGTS